ncbi:MAG TPA: GNAT family N-acetyltransferase [Nocardioidaceae bacterium]|nr:GNAT family N-acetyltransferase [Nocardioidaceae bacterium]
MDEAPEYPRQWEADVVLRDGRVAHLRPIRPEDADALVEFYEGVSDESRYLRFFSPMPRLSPRDVERFTNVDHVDRVGLVMTVAGRIIAFGQYERLPDDHAKHDHVEAEVAFLVQDAHQGRGIAQLLLEHLAQSARERSIEMFVAEILPGNQAMIGVFQEAGYSVVRAFEDGVMRLEFPVDSTQTSLDVMQAREHRAEAASIQAFLEARSVAVVGASRRAETIGRTLVRNLVLGDFQGRVYAVNSSAESVAGMPAYAAVSDIPDDVDIAVVAVPAEAVPEVVLDCANKGVHGIIVVSAGFAETGDEGRRRQRRLVGLARGYGLRLVGPNALGIVNTASHVSLNASLAPVMPPRGRAGFFCQSGALGVAILENVSRRGLGISTFVSAGNRADVSGNDLLQYWEEDDATEVVLLYLESIGNPRKFSRIARRVSRRKPVIAVKSGRATQGVPMGHAVRESTLGQAAVDAMFRQAGVIQVDTLDDMFDVAQLLAHQPLPAGGRVAVVGNSDALGLLAADAAAAVGLTVTHSVALGADASAEDFEHALDRAIDHKDADAVLVVYIPPLASTSKEVADVIAAVGEQSDKPVLTTFLATEGIPELLRVPDVAGSSAGRGSVPSYTSPEAAVRALARACEYAAWRAEPEGDVVMPADVDTDRALTRLGEILAEAPEGRELTDEELAEVLAAYGIQLWARAQVNTEEEALEAGERFGWGVVLKATAEHLRQRPDLAHVWRNIDTAEEMSDAWHTMRALIESPDDAGFMVQRSAASGVPVTLRGVEDPLFGPVVSFGISGAATELLGDRSFRIPPLHAGDAASMVREVKAAPLLFGYRGSELVAIEPIEDLLLRLAQLKNDLPQVRELELSLVLAGATQATVLTAQARVEPGIDARSDWFVRRLNVQAGDTFIS